MVPQAEELAPLLRELERRSHAIRPMRVGRIECAMVDDLGIALAVGGQGKVQLAVHAQHFVEQVPGVTSIVCAGAAGRLRPDLRLGDVIVGTGCIEHDYRSRFARRPLPCYLPDERIVDGLRAVARNLREGFDIHFGLIASGDEDVVDRERAQGLRAETDALCVAWEGAGAARAAAFNGLPFLEIRAISDGADTAAAHDFHANLSIVMPHVAAVLAAGWRVAGWAGLSGPR